METFNEYLNNQSLVEMARINDPKTYPVDIFVYGGNSYGKERNEHGEPHFLYEKKGKIKTRILIPTLEEWDISKKLKELDNVLPSNLIKELIKWLDEKNNDAPEYTNIQMMRLQWNILNKDNKNVKKFDKIK